MTNEYEYQALLGDELKSLRKKHGWTRKDLCARLPRELSLQTIATYENGTRTCSVARLATLCRALGARPQDVIARVEQRLYLDIDDESGMLRLDLDAVARTTDPRLVPLRRWAADRVGGSPGEVLLPPSAVQPLAELCGVSLRTLVQQLDELRGLRNAAPSRQCSAWSERAFAENLTRNR